MNNSILRKASSALSGWHAHRRAIKELSSMPNYLLADLGIDRGEIRSVVYGFPSNASVDAMNANRLRDI